MRHCACYLLLAFGIALAGGCVPHTTNLNEVGIRTHKLSLFGKAGVENKIYAPGSTYFFLPFLNDWHTLDIKLQNAEMTFDRGRGERADRDDLVFKTIDGNDISLDVIIAFRIDQEKAPYIIQYVAQDNAMLREKIVRTIARSKPRDIFGELKTEEFYIADKREAKAQKAKAEIQKIVEPLGIIIERVLTKDYRFNKDYQKAIEDKKVADQLVEKNKSAQHAAVEEYKRLLEDARGEVNKMRAAVDGEYERAKIEADAYYNQQKNIAEAIKAEGLAEAEGIKEMTRAMADMGGEAMIKLKIAESLAGKRIILLPTSDGGMNLKTMDMNKLIETIGIKSLAADKK